MKTELLEIKNGFVKKADEYLLRQIQFHICEGETVSICGLHGSGKTVLAKVLSGKLDLSEGDIYLNGEKLTASYGKGANQLQKYGVRHFFELPEAIYDFRIYDYIFTMRPSNWRNILYSKKNAKIQTENLLEEAGIDLAPSMFIDELNHWQKFMLQILKYAVHGGKLIILDEVANEFGMEILWPFLEKMKKKYGLTYVYVSSTVDMAAEASDRIYIMRENSLVYMAYRGEEKQYDLKSAMFQYDIPNTRDYVSNKKNSIIFKTEIPSPLGQGIPLEIKEGEIAGILDLDGKLREDIIEYYTKGYLSNTYVEGKSVHSYKQLNKNEIYIVYEKEQRDVFFRDLTIQENVLVSGYERYRKLLRVNDKLMKYLWEKKAEVALGQYDEAHLTALDKLKIILLRKLILNPKLLILDNLTLYLDPLEQEEILQFIEREAAGGVSFLLISSNLPEAYRVCDKILILEGKGNWRLFERQPE
ncbi:MAG: ATP-binding cassette domain-containing protein [Ruminococcus sp.]|nr:ATP-binding cassette domain-containing protein [Ruminococcus sp.]